MPTNVYTVIHQPNRWLVRLNDRYRKAFVTRTDAIEYARMEAARHRPSEVIVRETIDIEAPQGAPPPEVV